MTHCPLCFHPIESTALVAAFNDPPGWSFWGEPGRRWIVCQSGPYIHFRAQVAGRMIHRLATIAGDALAVPTPAPTPAPLDELPLFSSAARPAQEDWL